MAYTDWGDPDNPRVIVCVHGLTRVSRDFDPFARAMADEFRVVCPDVAGRGRSDWLPDPMLYDVKTYIADMVTLIARLDVAAVDWFGTSLGGLVGMGLASLPHSPIRRMLLNDVGPVLKGEALKRIAEYAGKPMHFPDVDAAVPYIRAISESFGPHTEAEWRRLTEIVLRPEKDGFTLHYDPNIGVPFAPLRDKPPQNAELWNVYDAIRCKTLAVRGAQSDLLAPETHAEMATRGPRARLVTLPGVGHAPTFQHADQIAVARSFFLEPD